MYTFRPDLDGRVVPVWTPSCTNKTIPVFPTWIARAAINEPQQLLISKVEIILTFNIEVDRVWLSRSFAVPGTARVLAGVHGWQPVKAQHARAHDAVVAAASVQVFTVVLPLHPGWRVALHLAHKTVPLTDQGCGILWGLHDDGLCIWGKYVAQLECA